MIRRIVICAVLAAGCGTHSKPSENTCPQPQQPQQQPGGNYGGGGYYDNNPPGDWQQDPSDGNQGPSEPQQPPQSVPSWADVEPVIQARCSRCHANAAFVRSESGYRASSSFARVSNGSMPTPGSRESSEMTEEERELLLRF